MADSRLEDARRCASGGNWQGAWQISNAVINEHSQNADALHLRGVAAYKLRRFGEAIGDLSAAAELAPSKAQLWDHLGAANADCGRWSEARSCFELALALNPSSADVVYNLGKVYRQEDRDDKAIEMFTRASQLRPTFWEAFVNLGNTCRDLGKFEAAEAAYRHAIALRPQHARSWNQLAALHLKRLDWIAAQAAATKALSLNADYPQALFNLGDAYRALGQFEQASECYGQVLQGEAACRTADLSPGGGSSAIQALTAKSQIVSARPMGKAQTVQLTLANRLRDSGRAEEAINQYHEVLRQDAQRAAVWNSLGSCLLSARRLDDAESAFRKALDLQPDFAAAENNLAAVWIAQGKLDEACEAFGRVASRLPNYADARSNYGGALQDLGRFTEASRELDRAIELQSDFPDARWNRSLLWLRQYDWGRGWQEYEARWQRLEFCRQQFRAPPGSAIDRPEYAAHQVAERISEAPVWRGEPLQQKRILLFAEQGLGDAIQFVRFAKNFKSLGAQVIVESPRSLVELFRKSEIADQVVAQGRLLPPHDFQLALLSVPAAHRFTSDAEITPAGPYLQADKRLVATWRAKLARRDGLKVGIHWQGNPAYNMDRYRSIPLAEFQPLSESPNVRLISLQHGFGCEQIDMLDKQMKIETLGEVDREAGPFSDTPAILRSLNLLITSDSALPHLAGALGVKTWLMLPAVTDWRWGIEGDTTPWYPTVRLFRQRVLGDWSGVFQRVVAALLEEISR